MVLTENDYNTAHQNGIKEKAQGQLESKDHCCTLCAVGSATQSQASGDTTLVRPSYAMFVVLIEKHPHLREDIVIDKDYCVSVTVILMGRNTF